MISLVDGRSSAGNGHGGAGMWRHLSVRHQTMGDPRAMDRTDEEAAAPDSVARVILRCTGKVLALLRLPAALPVVEPGPDDWYMNLLWVQRRKCLLITHATTLFSVFLPDITVADLRPPGPTVVAAVQAALRTEDLPDDALGPLDPNQVVVTKTASRRILGAMNDHVTLIDHLLAEQGGLAGCDLNALHHVLHRTINSVTGYTPPIEAITSR